MKLALSVLILAKNEEKNIGDCIKSVRFADEIVVIDDNSEDRTAEIAREMGARVVQHAMEDDWGQQQTFAIAQATHEWIYFIDADERMTEKLAEYVKRAVESGERYTYRNARLSYFYGQPIRHGGWFPDYGIHLLPKAGSYVSGYVHQQIHHKYEEKRFPVDGYLIHYPYTDWGHYIEKLNRYTALAAKEKHDAGGSPSFLSILLHPLAAFFKAFFLKSGWKDGRVGFILAMYHTFSTMVKYVKFYYMAQEPRAALVKPVQA